MLKNRVGLYNVFFFIFTQSLLNPPLCRFRAGSVNIFIYNMCFFQQTISQMRKGFTQWGHCVGLQWSYDHIHEYMNIMRVNIECITGCKRIEQRRIFLVPGYLRIILWKISTAISIKHRILATFNIKKINLSDCMPLNKIKAKYSENA